MRLGRCGSRVWACALACAVLLEVAQGFAPAPVLPPRPARAVSAVRMQADTTRPAAASGQQDDGANGVDPAYPYLFDGRLWFRPAIVRVPEEMPAGLAPISLFGYSIGGVVSLEYDASPVGPYREYVTMGALVTKRGAVGQWGSRLFVSTQPAEEVCQRVWGVPAEVAAIDFVEDGDALRVDAPPPLLKLPGAPSPSIAVSGWRSTRSSSDGGTRRGALPVLWTPTIKALWAPLIPFAATDSATALPLHKLRLSAKSLRVHMSLQTPSEMLGWPLPVGLSVDGVRIEIGPRLATESL